MVVASLSAVLSFSDLGIGNGVMNAVASASGRGDRKAVRTAISSGYFALSLVCIVLLTTFLITRGFVKWGDLLNVAPSARAEADLAVTVFAVCFCLSIPLALIQKIQAGLQEGFKSSLWQCAASISGLFGVLVVVWLRLDVPALALALLGPPIAVNVLNAIEHFVRSGALLAPNISHIEGATVLLLIRRGGLFFALQLVVALSYWPDSLIIAHFYGAEAVGPYAVAQQLFLLVGQIIAMLVAPTWPAFAEANARGDSAWIAKALRHSIMISAGLAAFLSFSVVLLAPAIFHFWLSGLLNYSLAILLTMAAWRFVESTGNSVAMYLNGTNVVAIQISIAVTTGIVMFMLKILMIQSFGLSGLPAAAAISYSIFTLIPYGILLFRRGLLSTPGRYS